MKKRKTADANRRAKVYVAKQPSTAAGEPAGDGKPGLAKILPFGGSHGDNEPVQYAVSDENAAALEAELTAILRSYKLDGLLDKSIVEADSDLGQLDTPILWAIGRRIGAAAEKIGVQFPALTALHRYAMCISDHLRVRGESLP